MSPEFQRRKGVAWPVTSGVTSSMPGRSSFSGSRVRSSTVSMKYRSVQMWMPSWALPSPPIRPASDMPKTSNTSAPQSRLSFSRLASDSVSAAVMIRAMLLSRRSMPSASAMFAMCSAKLGMPTSTVGRIFSISSSCIRVGMALPAPAHSTPTPAPWAPRAQTWPAGCTPMGKQICASSPGGVSVTPQARRHDSMPKSTSAKVRG